MTGGRKTEIISRDGAFIGHVIIDYCPLKEKQTKTLTKYIPWQNRLRNWIYFALIKQNEERDGVAGLSTVRKAETDHKFVGNIRTVGVH